ncbi:MAG: helix-turn-helix domain-containing protein, partial [Bacteroidota bacterium]|nr:helix-turn-helix domain-containing protein [Bacteroidota bacterium]
SSVESYRAGADAFVVKPFSVDYLLVRIQNLLEQRRKLFERFDQKPEAASDQKKVMDLSPSPVTITDKDEKFLRDVIKIVEDNMMESDFDIDKIASSTTLGRTTFYNKLKGLTGMSPVEFVRDIRVKRALQYLESGQYSVSEAAYQAGFNNPHYFSQCFKKKYGYSPSEFLKQRSSDNEKGDE